MRPIVVYMTVEALSTRVYEVADRPGIRVHMADVGLACCGVEVGAAITRGLLIPATDSAAAVSMSVLVVSGTVTDVMAPMVLQTWSAMPQPARALAFGACTASGGPYWDSYSVTKGIDQLLPVSRYVPGCPPRPEALLNAIIALGEQDLG